jgi:tetratricopeptide (TPR) repeat protein
MAAGHAPASRDCAGCHMQVRAAYDGAHTAFTDHRILRRPAPEPAGPPSWRLAAWREPAAALAQRALGLAYVAAGERSQSAERLNEGFRLLSALREPVDADVLTALGLVLLRKEAPTEAARLFARVVRERPTEADAYLNLAAARHAAGNTAQAIADLERALELDPYLQDAYMLMARMGPPERRRRVLERYLSVMPQHLEARRALRGLP